MDFSMMRSSAGAMQSAALARMRQADEAIKALSDPMTLAIEHGIQFFTFAAAGYTSGRYANPKVGPVPYEFIVALPAYGLALASMYYGGSIPGGPIAGRIADQVGTIMLGTYVFKFAAGYGKSQAPSTVATTPPAKTTAGSHGHPTNFTRHEITGAGAGMGALSAAEAARLSR